MECDCRLFHWYKICQHALAASVDIGISFKYLTEVKKKVRQGKGSLTGAVNTTRKLSKKGMKKNEVKKAAKKSKTSKPNVICGEVAPQKPERNERQPTSLNQENLGRCQNIDQSQLSISTKTIGNMRDVNQNMNKKKIKLSLCQMIEQTHPLITRNATNKFVLPI